MRSICTAKSNLLNDWDHACQADPNWSAGDWRHHHCPSATLVLDNKNVSLGCSVKKKASVCAFLFPKSNKLLPPPIKSTFATWKSALIGMVLKVWEEEQLCVLTVSQHTGCTHWHRCFHRCRTPEQGSVGRPGSALSQGRKASERKKQKHTALGMFSQESTLQINAFIILIGTTTHLSQVSRLFRICKESRWLK